MQPIKNEEVARDGYDLSSCFKIIGPMLMLGLGIKEEIGNHAWFMSTLEKKIKGC